MGQLISINMRKILLGKSQGKKSINNNNGIPITLDRNTLLFHDEIISDTINTMEVYNNEKNNTTKHRFIFTINPICTNSIFNKITEVVFKEGSSKCQNLDNSENEIVFTSAISQQPVNRKQAIRNTEYTNPEYEMTYHCGVDIFNNHLLRSKENKPVQKRNSNTKNDMNYRLYYDGGATEIDGFNTIGDYDRDYNGNVLFTNLTNNKELYESGVSNKQKLPLYIYDEIKDFVTAYNDGITRKDGWIGFTNPSTMRIPVESNYFVNKCFNDKEACQFIDMCPERDLFYFSPKRNKYRKRLEYNWDYFLTYPSESIYDDGNILKGKNNGLPLNIIDTVVKKENNNISTTDYKYKRYNGSSGTPLVMFRSVVKHNLKPGDYILLKSENDKGDIKNSVKCYVVNTGTLDTEDKDYCFSVYESDIEDLKNETENSNNSLYNFTRFAKIVSGFECEYYYRKFSKFKENLHSTINKLSFANTIYGDEVSQIIFTDSLDISNYKDNRGRPLTDVYLTIIKTNRGHEEWYNENNFDSKKVEYSHVFGKISSGLDLPTQTDNDYPVIRRQHNIKDGAGFKKFKNDNEKPEAQIDESSPKLEGNITKDGNLTGYDKNGVPVYEDIFYGDLIEFNPITLNETTLENVYHRFNTAQREKTDGWYGILFYDEIDRDIYDSTFNEDNDPDCQSYPKIREYKMNEGYANLDPEGYIYKPHHKIQIGMFSGTINQLSDTPIQIDKDNKDVNEKSFATKENYKLSKNDIITAVTKSNFSKIELTVESYQFNPEKNNYLCTVSCKENINDFNIENYILFKPNINIPDFAYMLPDGSGRYLWRDIVKPSEYTYKDALNNIPFTNGAFYHHTNIMFFVRRQDPFRKYGMFVKDASSAIIENNFNIPSVEYDTTIDEYIIENEYKSCL